MGVYHKWLGGYEDAKGRKWRNRRPNGWPTDGKAPDGFTVSGYRSIDQKGRIRFSGSYWSHPDYIPGRMVYVWLNDCYGCEIKTVVIDAKWTPDTIGDDVKSFIEHSHEIMAAVAPDSVGEWNKRTPA